MKIIRSALFFIACISAIGARAADESTYLDGKNRLVCGGILAGAEVAVSEGGIPLVIANTFSEICAETDLALNLYPASNCHLVGDVWNFRDILISNSSLAAHRFQHIYFNHIGNGFWADHYDEEERKKSEACGSVEDDVREKIIHLFSPLISVLSQGGTFVYQSFVNDWLEDFWQETQLDFLTKDALRAQPKSTSEREYPSHSEGRMKRIETAYSLSGIDHPIIRGYFGALGALGLSNIAVELVLADRTSLEAGKAYTLLPESVRLEIEPPTESQSLEIPDIDKQSTNKGEYNSGNSSFSIFDIFIRMKGTK